jgi:TP901 family phage tail tape measure protein
MAVPDLEKIVKIIFAGDDTNLGQTITSVGGGLDTLGVKVGKATQPFADLTSSIIKIDAVLAGLAVGSLVLATKAAGDFSDSFAEISTLIDVPKESLEGFRNSILDYAASSTQSIEDINASIYDAISAGEDYKTSLGLLEAAEQLGVATKADLNTAINLLKPTLNAFGESTESAADFADILFTTVKTGKTTLGELAPVLANVTGIANNAGVPFSDLAAAIAALTASGVETSQAVTQIKGALTAVLAPTEQAKKAAQELGIALGKEAIEARGIEGVFNDLITATGGNIEQLKILIPRIEGLNAVLVLGKDASGIFANALQAMEDRAGNASDAYAKMADNFELVNQRLINNIKKALIDVGEPLLDDWGKLALSIVNILRGIEDQPINWGNVFGPLIELSEDLLSDLSDYFNEIALVLPDALENIDWSGFTGAMQDLVDTGKDLLGQLLGGLDLTKAEDLEIAIQKLVDTFTNWVKLTEGIIEGLAPFIVKIGELVSKFGEMDEATLKSIGQFFGLATGINKIAELIPSLTGALNILSGAIGLLSVTRIPALISAFGTIGGGGLAGSIGILVKAFAPLTAIVAAFGLANPDEGIGKWLKENSDAFKTFSEWVDTAYLKLVGIDDQQIKSLETGGQQKQLLAELAVTVDDWVKSLNAVPEEVTPTVELELEAFFDDIDFFTQTLDELSGTVVAGTVDLELDAFYADIDAMDEALRVDAEIIKKVDLELDEFFADIDSAEEELQKVTGDKILEIKIQGEIDIELAKIKAQAETIQSAFEWTAKVEIANIEAQAEEFIALAELSGAAWESTADIISSALSVLADTDLSAVRWHDVIDIIDREQDIREDLAEQLIKLQDAQVALINARTKAIAEGKGIITITTDGLEPELEQVLFSIVQKAQVKANEEGFNALLGI